MIIEPYDPSDGEGVIRLSLRAWAPVFDSLKQVFAPPVYDTFYPEGWRVVQEKSVPARAAYARAGFGLFPVARYFQKL